VSVGEQDACFRTRSEIIGNYDTPTWALSKLYSFYTKRLRMLCMTAEETASIMSQSKQLNTWQILISSV